MKPHLACLLSAGRAGTQRVDGHDFATPRIKSRRKGIVRDFTEKNKKKSFFSLLLFLCVSVSLWLMVFWFFGFSFQSSIRVSARNSDSPMG
jgi:hypothetical protein